MKKTVSASIGGFVFHVEEDAYVMIDSYLQNLRMYFRNEEGADEIVRDLEDRISEILLGRLSSSKEVVTRADVEAVIEQIGRPEEIDEEAQLYGEGAPAGVAHESREGASAHGEGTERKRRRLFRDPDDKLLGGVASGIAAFYGLDPMVVRLLFIISFFFSASISSVVYIAFWILLPEAVTATEKLQMRGEAVTVENIGRSVKDAFSKNEGSTSENRNKTERTILQRFGDGITQIAAFLFKICLVVAGVFAVPLLLIVVLIVAVYVGISIVELFVGGLSFTGYLYDHFHIGYFNDLNPALAFSIGLSVILSLLIPLGVLLYMVMQAAFKWQPISKGLRITLLIVWLISVVFTILAFVFGWWQPLEYSYLMNSF